MNRRNFLGMMVALPLLPALELETTPVVLPPIVGEQPGCVFFDNLSTLDWSSVDGSVRYYDWMGKLLGVWKPGQAGHEEACQMFVKWPIELLRSSPTPTHK